MGYSIVGAKHEQPVAVPALPDQIGIWNLPPPVRLRFTFFPILLGEQPENLQLIRRIIAYNFPAHTACLCHMTSLSRRVYRQDHFYQVKTFPREVSLFDARQPPLLWSNRYRGRPG